MNYFRFRIYTIVGSPAFPCHVFAGLRVAVAFVAI